MAGALGIEPSSGVLETLILPMNYAPILTMLILAFFLFIFKHFYKKSNIIKKYIENNIFSEYNWVNKKFTLFHKGEFVWDVL